MAKKRKPEPNRSRGRTKPTIAAPTPSGRTDYFHGGAPGLEPGDILRPAAALGLDFTYHLDDAVYDPAYVYFTTRIEIATAYAARCVMPYVNEIPGTVYRVQPLGRIEPDPDYEPLPDIYKRAPRARVLETVRTEVVLTDRETHQLEAPWLHWGTLDRPMYDTDGIMIPSDEMKANGVTSEHTRVYGPWLPWSRIHPRGSYFPTKKARQRGPEAIADEILDYVPGLDSAGHQVRVKGNYSVKGRDVSYKCICGFQRRGPHGPSPAAHQLGEPLLALLISPFQNDADQQLLAEALARAAAKRSPARWDWFTPMPVVVDEN